MIWDIIAKLFGPSAPITGTPPDLHDRRKYAIQAHGPKREWKVRNRKWSSVTGICLHQTACLLGERPERCDTVGAHIVILRSGAWVWLHDFNREVAHGNGWNTRCVGIEVDGLFAGDENDPSTVWDDPSTKVREQGMAPTTAQVERLKQIIKWIVEETGENGGKISALVAHRQSSKSRRNDPGSAIWKHAAVPMMAELGLSDGGVGFEIGGYPIPEVWDSRCKGIRY
jgi:N-acetylmuramoyl-L-alanine amidase-like protein